MIGDILKNVQKTSSFVLMLYENEAENEKKLKRYNLNRPRPRHGHKYTKYKMCLSIMMVVCIKQH